jgi:hypothetical protein
MNRNSISILIFIVSFIVLSGNQLQAQRMPNSIEIHDNQYACYNSMQYFIIDSSFSIGNYSEEGDMYDSGYTQEELLDTILTKTQIHIINRFIEHFPFDSLKPEYESGVQKSCDSLREIYIQINWKGKKKDIQIIDCYQVNVGMLFDMLNMLIPKDNPRKPLYNPDMLKFDYRPEQFQCKHLGK